MSEIDSIISGINRLANLRLVTNAENQRNRSMRSDNTSGVPGVSWNKRDSRWMAHIKINGQHKNLGYFDTLEEAAAARAKGRPPIWFSRQSRQNPARQSGGLLPWLS